MAAGPVFAHLFLSVGPAAVFYCLFIARKSFLVLLTLFSAFYWLTVLLFTSAIFRGFLPLNEAGKSYVGVLVVCVAIQEAARYGLWRIHSRGMDSLRQYATSRDLAITKLDQLSISVSWGFGHAACQVRHAISYTAGHL